jgi:hypothetical protein
MGLFQRRVISNPFERALNVYLALLVGMHIYITVFLEPFRCFKQFDGSFTLVASPNLNCFDGDWSIHWFSIYVGLFYIIGIPGILVFLFWKFRKSKNNNNAFAWRFGLLTSRYKQRYYWWSLYVLAKKTLFVMQVDLTNDYNIQLRSFMVLLVLIVAISIESLCKPHKSSFGFTRQLNLR